MAKTNPTPFSLKAASYIRDVYKKHQKIKLTNFMHDITFGKGQISMLVSNEEVFRFFHDNKIPMLCTDDSGRILPTGIYLNKTLQNTYKECSVIMPLLPKVAKQFNQNYGKNSVHFSVRENDCQHLYSLFFDLTTNEFLQWVVNNGNFMRDLIENYKTTAQDIILEAKSPTNRVTLPNSNQFYLSQSEKENLSKTIVSLIHKQMHIPIHLSPQQSKCLTLLMQGKSAKKIALEMHLSHRTVEHYLERIRTILSCSSNKELVAYYGNQLS